MRTIARLFFQLFHKKVRTTQRLPGLEKSYRNRKVAAGELWSGKFHRTNTEEALVGRLGIVNARAGSSPAYEVSARLEDDLNIALSGWFE